MNNAAYAFTIDGVTRCLKLYKVDQRDRAQREWAALTFLADRGVRIVPQPLWFDPAPNLPAIVMEYLPGVALNSVTFDQRIVRALAVALHEIYAITPAVADFPNTVAGPVESVIKRIAAWVELTADTNNPLIMTSRAWVVRWQASDDPAILLQPAQLVFGRGDPSLANCLWDGARVRFVDLEYAGWNDLAFELADLIEGPWARHVPDALWNALVTQFDLSARRPRFAAARRMVACSWLYKLSEQYARGAAVQDQLVQQLDRAQAVLAHQ